MTTDQPTAEPTGSTRQVHFQLSDLVEGLVWPKLFRAVPMALQPERVLLGVAVVVLLGLLGQVPAKWSDAPTIGTQLGREVENIAFQVQTLSPSRAMVAVLDLVDTAWQITAEHPTGMALFALLALILCVIPGGAISRSVATQFSLGHALPWPACLGMAISKASSLVGAFVGPAVFALAVYWIIAALGWLLLGVSFISILGGVVYGFALLMSLLVVVLLVLLAVGHPLLVPAVMCEGTDGIDGIQRAFAYTRSKPIRLVLYLAVVAAQGFVAAWLIINVAEWAVGFASGAATALLPIDTQIGLLNEPAAGESASAANWMLNLWNSIPGLLAAGFVVSYWYTASTLVYLLARRVNDGQEIAELWVPDRDRSQD